MVENEEKIELTAKEKKLVNISEWIYTAFILLFGVEQILFRKREISPNLYLWSNLLLILAGIMVLIVYMVIYFTCLRKIKKYFAQYTTLAVLMLFMNILHIWGVGIDCTADLIGGTKIVTTNEYIAHRDGTLYIYDNGEDIKLDIPKKTAILLQENQDYGITEQGLLIYENTVTVEYYPGTQLTAKVEYNG